MPSYSFAITIIGATIIIRCRAKEPPLAIALGSRLGGGGFQWKSQAYFLSENDNHPQNIAIGWKAGVETRILQKYEVTNFFSPLWTLHSFFHFTLHAWIMNENLTMCKISFPLNQILLYWWPVLNASRFSKLNFDKTWKISKLISCSTTSVYLKGGSSIKVIGE